MADLIGEPQIFLHELAYGAARARHDNVAEELGLELGYARGDCFQLGLDHESQGAPTGPASLLPCLMGGRLCPAYAALRRMPRSGVWVKALLFGSGMLTRNITRRSCIENMMTAWISPSACMSSDAP